jgi:hypothetical protein
VRTVRAARFAAQKNSRPKEGVARNLATAARRRKSAMKVLKQFGSIALAYIAIRTILAAFVPTAVSAVLSPIADFFLVVALISAVISLVLGGNSVLMYKIKGFIYSTLGAVILVIGLVSFIGGKLPFSPQDILPTPTPVAPSPIVPEPDNPPTPEPENPPTPEPEVPITPTPTPNTPVPTPAPVPKQPHYSEFYMGEDNYNFANNRSSFGYGSGYAISLERFKQIFSDNEAQQWYNIYAPWGGSCFGFSASSINFSNAKLNTASYQKDANMVYDFGLPKSNRSLLELMELYQISQSLTESLRVEKEGENNYAGLVSSMYMANGSVQRQGLIVCVRNGNVGHAVVAYDIQNAGNGVFYLSIYDNNYPNDTTRKMRFDTVNKTWQYGNYNQSTGYFRYISAAAVYNAIQNAKTNKISNMEKPMKIVVPSKNATITLKGQSVETLEGAIDATPFTGNDSGTKVWSVPQDVYDVSVINPLKKDEVVFFDSETSFAANVCKDALISGTTGNFGFITVDTDGKFTVKYFDEQMAENPITISGNTNEPFALKLSDGTLYMDGEGKFKVSQGNNSSVYELSASESTPIDLSDLQYHLPWWVFVIGIVVLCVLVAIGIKIFGK